MNTKNSFGEMLAKSLNIGDLVQWSKWNSDKSCWESHYGIIFQITNEIRSNRMVSISKVIPIHDQNAELEFFTVSLRLVSPIKEKQITQ